MKSFTLITGASSGIGLEMAKVFASKGHSLILTARSKDALESLAKEIRGRFEVTVEVLPLDLSKTEAPEVLFQECRKRNLPVDILVNNAGFGDNAVFATSEWKKQAEMIDLNIKSLVHLTHLFLPAMLAGKKGRILNVASVAAFQPGPFMAVYYATKSFVLGFSEAIGEELNGTGVTVTALCPGPTTSGFQKAAGMDDSLLFKMPVPSSQAVAEYGYDTLMAGKLVAIHGVTNKVMAFSTRLTPKFILLKVVRRLQMKRMQAHNPG